MTEVKIEHRNEDRDFLVEKVVLDNSPDLGDPSGQAFLNHFSQAISECQKSIANGYRLTDFWSNPDVGVAFVLKKKKDTEH